MNVMLRIAKKVYLIMFCLTLFGGGGVFAMDSDSHKALRHDARVSSVDYSPDDSLLMAECCFDNSFRIWNIEDGTVNKFETDITPLHGCFLDNDYILVWSSSSFPFLPEIRKVLSGDLVITSGERLGQCSEVFVSSDRKRFLTIKKGYTEETTITVWDFTIEGDSFYLNKVAETSEYAAKICAFNGNSIIASLKRRDSSIDEVAFLQIEDGSIVYKRGIKPIVKYDVVDAYCDKQSALVVLKHKKGHYLFDLVDEEEVRMFRDVLNQKGILGCKIICDRLFVIFKNRIEAYGFETAVVEEGFRQINARRATTARGRMKSRIIVSKEVEVKTMGFPAKFELSRTAPFFSDGLIGVCLCQSGFIPQQHKVLLFDFIHGVFVCLESHNAVYGIAISPNRKTCVLLEDSTLVQLFDLTKDSEWHAGIAVRD